jgi:hypothetical protein
VTLYAWGLPKPKQCAPPSLPADLLLLHLLMHPVGLGPDHHQSTKRTCLDWVSRAAGSGLVVARSPYAWALHMPGPKPNIGVRNLTCGVLLLLLAHTSDAESHTGPPAVFISPPQKTKRGGNHLHERLVGSSCMLCHHRTDIIL